MSCWVLQFNWYALIWSSLKNSWRARVKGALETHSLIDEMSWNNTFCVKVRPCLVEDFLDLKHALQCLQDWRVWCRNSGNPGSSSDLLGSSIIGLALTRLSNCSFAPRRYLGWYLLNNSSQSWTCNRPQTGWVCCVPFARTRVDNSFNSFPKRYRSTLIREIIATNSVKNLLCATRCSLRWQLTARESRYNYLGTKIFAKKVWSSQENELNIMYTILIDNNAVESGLVLQKL